MAAMTMDDVRALIKEVVSDEIAPIKESQSAYFSELGKALGKGQPKDTPKGQNTSRMIMALAANKGDGDKAVAWAIKQWPDQAEHFEKALAAQVASGGGFLIDEEFDDGIIELLRPASVIRSLNPIMVGLDSGALRIPKHTSGSNGGWIGENVNAPATQPAFGQIVLQAHKYASLVPISNDLIRRAAMSAQTMVRDDMVADIATATDLSFLRGDGTGGQPRGLRFLSSNTTAANAVVSLANVVTDLGKVIQSLMDNFIRMLRPAWIFSPRTWRYLFTVLDGNGNFVFKSELEGGTLFGFPFKVTTQVPINLGSGSDESEVYFIDFADVVVGEATGILVDASDTAAYHDGSNVVASFSLDQTVIRALIEVDINARHTDSLGVLTGVKWGA